MDGEFDSAAWGALLSRELDAPVEVSFGRARRQVLVARPVGSGYRVRMNAGFRAAPPEVRTAVARWLKSGRRAPAATRTLDAWIEEVLLPSFTAEPARREPAQPRGDHHDLTAYAAELCPRHLSEELLPPERMPELTWGRRAKTGARRSLHLGTYDAVAHRVRIHRVLDQRAVPPFFVRYVLFHELLHAALPPRRRGSRIEHHGPEFRRAEARYVDFERAKRWEDENVDRLLRSARTGKPMRALRARLQAPAEWVQRILFD